MAPKSPRKKSPKLKSPKPKSPKPKSPKPKSPKPKSPKSKSPKRKGPKLSKAQKKALKKALELEKFRDEKRKEIQRNIAEQAKKKREIDQSLRKMVVEIKVPLLRKEVQAMHQTFTRAHDRKQCYIDHVLRIIDVAEDQYFRNFINFYERLDITINKFLSDLKELMDENKRRTDEVLKQAEDEANYNAYRDSNAEIHLQLILYQSNKTFIDYIWEKSGQYWVEEKNDRLTYLDILVNLQSFLENSINVMWNEFANLVKNYHEQTAENKKHIRSLKNKEIKMMDIINKQALKLEKSNELLEKLRTEYAGYESGNKQAYFRNRRDRYRVAHAKMVSYVVKVNKLDAWQLSFLLQNSDDATDWLKAAHTKIEKIHRVAKMCRRLETVREKVLPYDFKDAPVPFEAKKFTPLVPDALTNTAGMAGLWYRISKAELVKRALQREKRMLQKNIKAMNRRLQPAGETEPDEKIRARSSYGSECVCSRNMSVLDLLFPIIPLKSR